MYTYFVLLSFQSKGARQGLRVPHRNCPFSLKMGTGQVCPPPPYQPVPLHIIVVTAELNMDFMSGADTTGVTHVYW